MDKLGNPRWIEAGFRPDLIDKKLSVWLDHFRWVSALMVAASHTRNLLMPDAHPSLLWPEKILYFFTLFATEAVVIFFVLSGLLVGGTIVRRTRANTFVLSDYFIDRAARLYIVLLPALLLSLALQWAGQSLRCLHPDSFGRILGNLVFLQNFRIAPPLFNNTPLWTLSSDAFFYLLAPLLLIAFSRRSPIACAACGVLIAASLATYVADRSWTGFGLLLWFAGLIPWFLRLRIRAPVMALPVLAILMLTRFHLIGGRISEVILALAFALLLASDFSAARTPFAKSAAVFAGFSYSLYAIHMPIAQAIVLHTGFQGLPSGRASTYLAYAATLVSMVALGWTFGRLFEARTGFLRRTMHGFIDGSSRPSRVRT